MALPPFLETLDQHVLVCDGAMGTCLYAQGVFVNRCFDGLRRRRPRGCSGGASPAIVLKSLDDTI